MSEKIDEVKLSACGVPRHNILVLKAAEKINDSRSGTPDRVYLISQTEPECHQYAFAISTIVEEICERKSHARTI